MTLSRLDRVNASFQAETELLHNKFLAIVSDAACIACQSAGFGEAILTAWLQTKWSDFTRDLVIASALGTRRKRGNPVKPIAGVKSEEDAEKLVRAATTSTVNKRGMLGPIWHAPWFVIEVSTLIGLRNLPRLEAALGPSDTPKQITDFRNYLVHPNKRTRSKYESLQAKFGMLRVEPEHLLHQQHNPGLTVFTLWIRELQRIANDSTR